MARSNRNTDRLNITLDIEVSEELDRFAHENNENKSRIIENALAEYLDMDRGAVLEEKLDILLSQIGEGGAPSPTPSERPTGKKKENVEDSTNSFEYDPDAELGRSLETDEIHEILEQDEPMINSDHVGGSVPRDTKPRTELLHACARYDRSGDGVMGMVRREDAEELVEDIFGDSDHYQDKYVPKLLEDLTPLKRANGNGEVIDGMLYSFTEEATREWYAGLFNEWWADATLEDFSDQGDLAQHRTQMAAFRDHYLEYEITDEEFWAECRDNLLDLEIAALPEGDGE
jgi:hypothetical protein